MPRCKTCNLLYPPDFTTIVQEEPVKEYKCEFCEKGQEYIIRDDILFRKDEVIYDYEKFLERMKSNENLRKAHQEKLIKDMIKKDKLAGLIE